MNPDNKRTKSSTQNSSAINHHNSENYTGPVAGQRSSHTSKPLRSSPRHSHQAATAHRPPGLTEQAPFVSKTHATPPSLNQPGSVSASQALDGTPLKPTSETTLNLMMQTLIKFQVSQAQSLKDMLEALQEANAIHNQTEKQVHAISDAFISFNQQITAIFSELMDAPTLKLNDENRCFAPQEIKARIHSAIRVLEAAPSNSSAPIFDHSGGPEPVTNFRAASTNSMALPVGPVPPGHRQAYAPERTLPHAHPNGVYKALIVDKPGRTASQLPFEGPYARSTTSDTPLRPSTPIVPQLLQYNSLVPLSPIKLAPIDTSLPFSSSLSFDEPRSPFTNLFEWDEPETTLEHGHNHFKRPKHT